MVTLNAVQTENLSTALVVARAWAVASGVSPQAAAERVAFCAWSESSGGYIYANDGSNRSNSPGFDRHPEWPAILRKSLNIRHDRVGNNGRSTGMYQQISGDVGGVWGDMAGTMDPAISTARFLARLVITTNNRYEGWLLKTDGTKEFVSRELADPIAADVLRVQQPLVNEALSSNYDGSQVAIAREIVQQLSPSTGEVDITDWITMADQGLLDVQWDRITDRVHDYKAGGKQSLADFLSNFQIHAQRAVTSAVGSILDALGESSRTLRVVRDKAPEAQGACYLVGSGIFRWLSGAELKAWQKTGLVSSKVTDLEHSEIVELASGVSARAGNNGILWSPSIVNPTSARPR